MSRLPPDYDPRRPPGLLPPRVAGVVIVSIVLVVAFAVLVSWAAGWLP
jgi:hypothetical protein